MRAALLDPRDARWSAVLERVDHDVYHLPGYAVLAARQEGAYPTALLVEDGPAALLVPLLVRPLPAALGAPPAWRDAVSPYGYASPLAVGAPGPERRARLFARFVEEGARAGLVTAFLRLHPLLPDDGVPPDAPRVAHGQTVHADLRQRWAELERQVRSGHRYDARRLARDGYRARFDAWEDLPAFVEMYGATMARVRAAAAYRFTGAYFQGLRPALGEHVHLGTVLSPEGRPAAGALFLEMHGRVQYHLSATADAHVPRAPTKLLLLEALRWAQARGHHTLHLGGGVGGAADSLFQFKAGFAPGRARYATVPLVLDAARARELEERWRALGAPDVPGYFPRYRQPASAQGVPAPGATLDGRPRP